MMKALGFNQHGDISVMAIFTTEPPEPKENEVLVEIKASAFNHLDIWVRQGWPGLQLKFPHISGSDGAGIIRQVGKGVNTFQVGQRVAINPGINLWEDEYTLSGQQSMSPGFHILGEQLPGTHTQYIAVPAENCLLLPEEIPFSDAVAIGLVGLTAWRMLVVRGQMQMGQKVLLIGAGGGVNSVALQLAKLAGCEVYAITSSQEKVKHAYELGADHVLNYKENQNWVRELKSMTQKEGFDIVVDNVGQATLKSSIELVKVGGKIVIVGNTSGPEVNMDLRYIFSKQISLVGSTMGNWNDYEAVMGLLFQSKIKPVIYKKLSFADGIMAMEMLEQGEQFGKIILINHG